MKQTHIRLFAVGIVLGGMLMFILLGFSQFPDNSRSNRAVTFTPTTDQLPRLIALEPTQVRPAATQARVPAAVEETSVPTRKITVSPTPTRLNLQNERQPEIIGYSAQERPLQVYTFGDGKRERMIVAGIHGGNEWNTITLANQLILHLDRHPDLVPENVKLYILPNLNPDGEARAHSKYGRLNHNGVDLNRNFPVNWKEQWDRAGCWNGLPSSGGTGPGSEPETVSLMDFISSHDIDALISYHSAALGIFPGGLPWDEASILLAESLAEVSSYPFPPIDTGCTYSGTLADYAVAAGAAAVDLELTNHIDTEFDQNLQILDVLLNFSPVAGSREAEP